MRWRRKKGTDAPGVEAAKAERKQSEQSRQEAVALAHDLHRIREENHFAQALRALIEDGG